MKPVEQLGAKVTYRGRSTLEFKRGELGVSEAWPISMGAECTAQLREVFR